MKYGNKKTVIDGQSFDSRAEAKRWRDLCLLEKAGQIKWLQRQVVIELLPKVKYSDAKRATPAVRYVADFCYTTHLGERVIEDVKGFRTAAYRLKRHMLKALHGLEVKEIQA